MISRCKICAILLLACGLEGGFGASQARAEVSAELRVLASQANSRAARQRLRRYAGSAGDAEQRGLAYFLLGYREYEAREFQAAFQDLDRAGRIAGFSLADYAEYYAALAAPLAGKAPAGLDVLKAFSRRFAASPLQRRALARYAEALLDSGRAAEAFEALTADPYTRRSPALERWLGKAYAQAGQAENAARTYQELYDSYPTAAESARAGEALEQLKRQLGASFPAVPLEIQTARAAKLLSASHAGEALREYGELLATEPHSPLAVRWKLGRARCHLRLHRPREALDDLQENLAANPALDAERLGLLVEAYVLQGDEQARELLLGQLGSLYPHSSAYAEALASAGDDYVRQGEWQKAAEYYRPLARLFPGTHLGEEASWRSAWAFYLYVHCSGGVPPPSCRGSVPQPNRPTDGEARRALADHLAEYPESAHVPAALYWLGRLAEEEGAVAEARQLYQALEGRFAQSYYAVEAATSSVHRRIAAASPIAGVRWTPSESANRTSSVHRRIPEAAKRLGGTPGRRDASAAADSPAWLAVVSLTRQIPSLGRSPLDPCAPPEPSREVLRARTLRALGLDDLAEQSLKDVLGEGSAEPDVLLALGRLHREQGNFSAALFDTVKLVGNYGDFDFSALPKEVWDLLYPRTYWSLVEENSSARGVDPYLVMALIRQESAFNPRAISRANARGLMQVLPQTATHRRRSRSWAARRLLSPDYNVRAGTEVLQELQSDFGGNREEVLAAYHAGEARVNSWLQKESFRDPAEFLESIPIPSTRIYVERVLRDSAVYRRLLTGAAPFANCRPLLRPSSETEPTATRKKNQRGGRQTFHEAPPRELSLLSPSADGPVSRFGF